MPVEIHHYNPEWPGLYEAERERVTARIGEHLAAVEHIGSTAVPGLAAKPIIDMMVGVADMDAAERCLGPLEALGYVYVPGHEVFFPERRFLQKEQAGRRTHHLHVVAIDSVFWDDQLLFRDHLRRHARAAAHYETLKRVLRDRCTDAEAYTAAMSAFIVEIVNLARSERDHR